MQVALYQIQCLVCCACGIIPRLKIDDEKEHKGNIVIRDLLSDKTKHEPDRRFTAEGLAGAT